MNGIGLFGIITVCSTLVIFIVCIVLYCRIQTKRHFKCPHCGARFKVAGMRTFFASRQGTDRLLSCPQCGMNCYMENIPDEEYTEEMRRADAERRRQEEEGE